jgi:dihydroxyacetone kinase
VTRLFNDPTAFAAEMSDGFVAANRRYVLATAGGVVRATAVPPGHVAVVIGGGSGHYPAFGGLVGPGLAAGAAMGNLFASPSTQQVHGVARAADAGGGILLTYGNYAGDVLNFDAAQEQLRAAGVDCRTVVVTDDVASASPAEKHKRRGIAGDLTVFKIAGAAAEAGAALDEVERLARHANERTRSFGVAFSGCTLPGADAALFEVPAGRMAVGLGIHGEPGIDETDVPTADGLAKLMVDTLLADLPEGLEAVAGQRVVPILNGLGSVKYEELFVVFGAVARYLEAAGIELVDPQVGEFCTSFDMAGASLTLFWVDDELERLWLAPCDTPAFRKNGVLAEATGEHADVEVATDEIGAASDASRRAAVRVLESLDATAAVIDRHVDELGRIDAVAGDGDHGIGMQRGATAAVAEARTALPRGAGAGTLLIRAADAWSDRAGGTSGALWGVMLRELGAAIGDDAAPTAASVSAGVTAALAGIQRFGKAEPGDKTMVDAIAPFTQTLATEVAAGRALAAAWGTAATAATAAAAATADLLPRMGRARPHAAKSLGTVDAGAYSFALIVTAVGEILNRGEDA